MGVPVQFTSIQEQTDDLPQAWKVQNIHHLPIVAQSYHENQIIHSRSPPSQQIKQFTQRKQHTKSTQSYLQLFNFIMAGTFNICNFLNQRQQGQCIYHFNAHPGGTHSCTAIRKLITKAADRGVYNVPLDTQPDSDYCSPNPPRAPHQQQQIQPVQQTPPQNTIPPAQLPRPPQLPARPQNQHVSANLVQIDQPTPILQESSIDELHSTVKSIIHDDSTS